MPERDVIYRDRREAGRRLARLLRTRYPERGDMLVLGLPRGGVPVAYEIAAALGVPLDVFLVRKLGLPGHEELAMGAIAGGGITVVNEDLVDGLGIGPDVIDTAVAGEMRELARREQLYRGGRPPPSLRDRTVVLVDDGLATGATMRAAVMAVRKDDAGEVIVAVPVGAAATCAALRGIADEVVCPETPEPFGSVGRWYLDFAQTTDAEVKSLLAPKRR